jgi:hypothetical protein
VSAAATAPFKVGERVLWRDCAETALVWRVYLQADAWRVHAGWLRPEGWNGSVDAPAGYFTRAS